MDYLTGLYQLTFVGQFMDSKINLLEAILMNSFAKQNRAISTI